MIKNGILENLRRANFKVGQNDTVTDFKLTSPFLERLNTAKNLRNLLEKIAIDRRQFKFVNDNQVFNHRAIFENESFQRNDLHDFVTERISQNDTVVLHSIQNFLPCVRDILLEIVEDYGNIEASCNLYYTPANAKGFDPHADAEDSLILQISGSKKWYFFEKSDFRYGESHTLKSSKIISEGDCIILPKGIPHCAQTLDKESTHLTISFDHFIDCENQSGLDL